MTASLKNLFGVVPGAVYGWPKNLLHFRGIENSILDLASTIRPRLAIVDAIVGMEGDGPIMGHAKPVGAVVMGDDLVSVDATCARLMGLKPALLGIYARRASSSVTFRRRRSTKEANRSRASPPASRSRQRSRPSRDPTGSLGQLFNLSQFPNIRPHALLLSSAVGSAARFSLVKEADGAVVVPDLTLAIDSASRRKGPAGPRRTSRGKWPDHRAFQCRAHVLHAFSHRHRLPDPRRRGPVDPVVGGSLAHGGVVSGLRCPRACGGPRGALWSDHRRTAEVASARSLSLTGTFVCLQGRTKERQARRKVFQCEKILSRKHKM
jgi:hypothetical protein